MSTDSIRSEEPLVSIDPIASPLFYRLLPVILVVGSLLAVVFVFGGPGPTDWMLFTGYVAALLAVLAFLRLMTLIDRAFTRIYRRGLIHPKTQRQDIEQDYPAFLRDIERLANHPLYQTALGVAFAAVGLWIWFGQFGLGLQSAVDLFLRPEAVPISQPVVFQIGFFVEPLVGFLIGVLAWRMVVVALAIWELSRRFRIVPQFSHVDGAGGLSPLGQLCWWNALIVTIPSLHFALWLALAPSIPRYARWADLLQRYIGILPLFALVGFFVPLYFIHQQMRTHRDDQQKELDEIAQRIDKITVELREGGDHLTEREINTRRAQLEALKATYDDTDDMPVWPFAPTTALQVVVPQVLPILALIGVGGLLLDGLRLLLGALGG